MLRVGLTGGIGAGKSAISELLAARGATIIDADQVAREIVEPGTPSWKAIVEKFGSGVQNADGSLDRTELGSIVFSDPELLRTLEAITHPAITERTAELEEQAGSEAIVVHDNPLLIDMGAHTRCDFVVVVDVPQSVQLTRLVELRGMREEDARARIRAQIGRTERTGAADYIIDNTGSRAELAAAVGGLWAELESLRS